MNLHVYEYFKYFKSLKESITGIIYFYCYFFLFLECVAYIQVEVGRL
jgi:hypothetical protein